MLITPSLFLISLFPREVVFVDGFKTGVLDMRIDLGGGNTGMAQHGLDGPQIGPMIQQVGGKRMPEHVG